MCSSSCRRRSQRRSSLRTLASSAPKGSSSSSTRARQRARARRCAGAARRAGAGSGRPASPAARAKQLHHALLDLRLAGALLARLDAQAKGDVVEHRHVAEQRVVLEQKPTWRSRTWVSGVFAVKTRPLSAVSSPAMMRSRVGLAAARGPSSATSSPEGKSRLTSPQRRKAAKLSCGCSGLECSFFLAMRGRGAPSTRPGIA